MAAGGFGWRLAFVLSPCSAKIGNSLSIKPFLGVVGSRSMHTMFSALLNLARAILVSKARLAAENAALRQQLAVYLRTHKRPKLKPADRVFCVTRHAMRTT